MTPQIPYLELSELVLFPAGSLWSGSPVLSIKPFGMLVSTGVYLGGWLSLSYGVRRGIAPRALGAFIIWVVSTGFIGGHVLDVIFYSPERLSEDPWVLLRIWEGLSSFGGFIGSAVGAVLFGLRHRVEVLPYADVVASALPVGWAFGRAGCAVVHDHPGIPSQAFFAVAYPDGGRLDLGLLELMLTIPIALAFLYLRRRAFPWGFFLGLLALVYAPLRFGLDFLRIETPILVGDAELLADPRYLGLTPAQWASVALATFGALLLFRSLRSASDEGSFAPPQPPKLLRGRS